MRNLITLLFFYPFLFHSQDYFPEKADLKYEPKLNNRLSIGLWYGIPDFLKFQADITEAISTGHLGAGINFILGEKVTLGLDYNYARLNGYRILYDGFWNAYDTLSQSIHTNRLQLRTNIYKKTKENSKILPFVGIGAGVTIRSGSYFNYNVSVVNNPLQPALSLRICYGLKFKISEKLIIGTELGLGGPLIRSGLYYRPNPYDFSLKKKLLEQEKRNKALAIENAKRAKKRQRIERFYAQVLNKLKEDLDPIEGVYKSVDLGERYEYDVCIFKTSNREYQGLILKSTDRDLNIGDELFTFQKTAQENLFFAKYRTKDGISYENKKAVLEGAMLTMGIKSFIKMYPVDGEKRSYNEINPSVDWESSGSGVLLNKFGFIATNNHVIKGAKTIRVVFQNDHLEYYAKIISQNEENDVAIIQIDDEDFNSQLVPPKFANEIKLGQDVFTLGYPISDKMSENVKVVDGIISGTTGKEGNKNYFQTTLPVWYGNSGGPCFNKKGEILGLATQIVYDKGVKVENVAYITKSNNILKLAGPLLNKSKESTNNEDLNLEQLVEKLVPYSTFIKVNY